MHKKPKSLYIAIPLYQAFLMCCLLHALGLPFDKLFHYFLFCLYMCLLGKYNVTFPHLLKFYYFATLCIPIVKYTHSSICI